MRPVLTVARSAAAGLRARRAGSPGRLRTPDLTPFADALDRFDAAEARRVSALTDAASVTRLHELLRSGEVSSVALTLLCLDRIRRRDGELRAVVDLDADALVHAEAADERLATGTATSPWCGVPVLVKDNVETAPPLRTTAGAAVLLDHVAAADAPLVHHLRAAGAVVLGKANLSELAGAVSHEAGFSAVGGRTVNPFGAHFSPGGSSSGSAVAVAAGFCVAAVGSETSGSLVAPASFTGVVTVKPVRTPTLTEGTVPLVAAQDCAGPLARSVADAASLLDVMRGGDGVVHVGGVGDVDDGPGGLDGVVAGVLRADVLSQRRGLEDPSDNASVLDRVVDALRTAGAQVRDARLGGGSATPDTVERGVLEVVLGGVTHETVAYVAAATRGTAREVSTLRDLMRHNLADVRRRMPTGQTFLDLAALRAPDAASAETRREALQGEARSLLEAALATDGVDVLVSLSNRHSAVYATAGWPAVSVPAGLRADGMPVGATLVARPADEGRLVAWAAALERALGPRPVPRSA